MPTVKTVTGFILFAANEASYGSGSALNGSTDAIDIVQEAPVFNVQFSYDGNRNGASYSGGNIRRQGPSGRTAQGTVMLEGKGLGATYTSASVPPNLHPFLQSAGFTASFSAGAWSYRPVAVNTQPKSLSLVAYSRNEYLPISGAFCGLKINGTGPGVTMFEFDVQGLAFDTVDNANPPARTFIAHDVVPPKNEAIGLTLGSYSTARVRSYSYEHGLAIDPRVNLNATLAHSGFVTGRRTPTFTVVIEADALSDFDAYAKHRDGEVLAVSLTVGSSALNRFTVSFPQAQITGLERTADASIALWNLTITPYVSQPDLNDDVLVSFD